MARAFIILRLPEESAAKNTLNIVEKEVSQRTKKENANMVELSKSRFEGQRRFQRL